MENPNKFNVFGNAKKINRNDIIRFVLAAIVGGVVGNTGLGCIRFGNHAGGGCNQADTWFEFNCETKEAHNNG